MFKNAADATREHAAVGTSGAAPVELTADNTPEIVVQSVYRRGYMVGEQVLRAAMVVVARPPERNESQSENEAGDEPAVEE